MTLLETALGSNGGRVPFGVRAELIQSLISIVLEAVNDPRVRNAVSSFGACFSRAPAAWNPRDVAKGVVLIDRRRP